MFHSSHIHMPNRHRQRTALRTFFPSSSFSPPDSKEPLRRGILFSSVAMVLLLVGAILTWLGFNDVFGGKISMTGPLLIALALLMLLLSFRQFMLARKRNRTTNVPVQMETMNCGSNVPAASDQEDLNGAATIVVESWDNDEPNIDPIRNPEELAPPSYMDIAQSFNSNCPSFFSHDDHNEAPPTYEETCAGFYNNGSETSLTQVGSRQSPSPHRTGQQGFFQNDPSFTASFGLTKQPHRLSNSLCPRTAANQRLNDNSTPHPQSCKLPYSTTDIVTDNCLFSPSTLSTLISSPDSNTVPSDIRDSNTVSSDSTAQWSRKSFSSIPSYTCLLSESGEVSAQVFNTSSIIEELMPTGDIGSTNIPTRSHSLTSVHVLRQGVPYGNLAPCHQQPSGVATHLPPQTIQGLQSISAVSPVPCSDCTSPKLNSSPTYHLQLRKSSDSNILDLLGSQSNQQSHFAELYSTSSLGTLPHQTVEGQSSGDLFGFPMSSHREIMKDSKVVSDTQLSVGHSQVLDVQETI